MIVSTPSIRARDLEKYQQWEELLVPGIIDRLTDPGDASAAHLDDRARALIGTAMVFLRIATNGWLESYGTEDPIEILTGLLSAVRKKIHSRR